MTRSVWAVFVLVQSTNQDIDKIWDLDSIKGSYTKATERQGFLISRGQSLNTIKIEEYPVEL